VNALRLPAWAVVSEKRRAHIERVTQLISEWAAARKLDVAGAAAWRDAGAWHDALRDAPPAQLGRPALDPGLPDWAWHGPAAAERLVAEGETRDDVLEAIRWHTLGEASWAATGRALFCADFLEPGRAFLKHERAALAARFPADPDGVLRDVVRMRLDKALREGEPIHPRTAALWEVVR
jgi:HD superfamily phosphohydrolase YqeK